jgi:hypothetical protein
MRLLPNEEELTSVNFNQFTLSNYRVEKQMKDWGEKSVVSIFLEDISSLEMKYASNLSFIFFGVLFVVAGFFVAVQFEITVGMIAGLIVGGVFFALWALTRKHIILIYPSGGAPMRIDVSGMANDKILDILHSISLAKQKRANELHKI